MSRTPEESFLARWSRLKRQPESGEPGDDVDGAPPANDADGDAGMQARARGGSGLEAAEQPGAAECEDDAVAGGDKPIRDFSQFDFEALDFQSDYTQFMGRDVPQEVRNKALRKLWLSNPVLANMDGLDDYCEDYTDAAMVPLAGVKTVYRIGRGFLSDSEVAEWEALGRKDEAEDVAAAVAGAEAADTDEDAGAGSVDATEQSARAGAADEAGETAETAASASVDSFDDQAGCPGAACAAVVKQEEQAALDSFDAPGSEARGSPDDFRRIGEAAGDAADDNDKAAT